MDSETIGSGRQDSDYDGAWKETLQRHLPHCLAKYFPAVHAAIDWQHPLQWCDQELSQVLGLAGSRNKRVDLLAKVHLHSGQLQWILLHLEIQSTPEPDFARRLAKYNSGLFWTFDQRVVTVAVLADLQADWLPSEDVFQLADFETRCKFPLCKLVDRLRDEWQEDRSLPVQVARAQIEALRTANDPQGRFQAKWQLVRSLYDAGYNAEQVRELFRLIDWMMHLTEELEQQLRAELARFEEQNQMPYITSVERLAKAEGGIAVILRLLDRLCGPLPADVEARVRSLSYPQVEALGDALLSFRSLDDVRKWLDAHDGSGSSTNEQGEST